MPLSWALTAKTEVDRDSELPDRVWLEAPLAQGFDRGGVQAGIVGRLQGLDVGNQTCAGVDEEFESPLAHDAARPGSQWIDRRGSIKEVAPSAAYRSISLLCHPGVDSKTDWDVDRVVGVRSDLPASQGLDCRPVQNRMTG